MGNKPIKSKKSKNKIKDGPPVERQMSSSKDKDMVIATLIRRNQIDGLPEPTVTNCVKPVPNGQPLPAPIPNVLPAMRQPKTSVSNVDTNESIVIAMYAYRAEHEGISVSERERS